MKKILIIDDETDFLNFSQSRLKSMGFEVFVAEDYHSGLKLAEEKKPDVIVVDNRLHDEKSGIDLIYVIKNTAYFNKPTVVLYSAYIPDEKCEADLIIKKPMSYHDMIKKIEEVTHDRD